MEWIEKLSEAAQSGQLLGFASLLKNLAGDLGEMWNEILSS